jgi:Arc/MetJ-type ribon-helix-helix transcriptional regulator
MHQNMKKKLSISIDEEKIELLENFLKQDRFRNKSHLIEYILNKFLMERKENETSI